MRTFIWTMVALIVVEVVIKLLQLAAGHIPQRSPANVAVDIFLNGAIACWGLVLLLA